MSSWSEPAPQGTTGTVKAAVGLTLLCIVLAVAEAILMVYFRQEIAAEPTTDADDLDVARWTFGSVVGGNLLLSVGLSAGAILTLRRSVAGKALIWIFGSFFALMRCGCGFLSGLLVYMYTSGEEDNTSPLPTGAWVGLVAFEVITLLAILAAMILLMTKAASFKTPEHSPGGPAGGYGTPYGAPGSPPGDGIPHLPPSSGWPT